MLRAARIVTGPVVSFAVVVAATGWLYVIQPHSALPGPAIGDALPLDELSRRSAVPLVVFLVVWSTAALSLGLIARAFRAERLTAGLMLGLGVGGWAYLQTGLSLLIVRQVPAHQAFHAAAGRTAVYLPAVLAGQQVFFNGLGLLQGGVAQRVSLQVLGIHVSLDILHD